MKLDNFTEIKNLAEHQLSSLCKDVRERILQVLSEKGGHLASNIGSVELTVALHRVFSSPIDKIIFDTSHQTYAHKILTGRNEQFPTIRQYQGLCGFASPKESDHDHFYAGHAGTALSLALGVAHARDLKGSDEYVIAVLGDAAFSCGLTLEALNNIPSSLSRFIIVLNDNDMFISESTGNINECLRNYVKQNRNAVEAALKRIMPKKIPDTKVSFFEHFGLNYIGIVDGHDVNALLEAFNSAKNIQGPVLIHTTTTKGHGMPKAAEDPTLYHGVGSFDVETGNLYKKAATSLTFPKIFGDYLTKMGQEDPDLVVITPAMPHGACLTDFFDAFPERSFDVGIAEGHAVTFAAGLAYQKKKNVVVSIYATFLQRALDNLFQDISLQELPVLLALDRGGLSPADGSTHHGIYDISFLQAMPGQVIVQPRDGDVLRDLMHSAFSYNRSVAIRYPNQPTKHTTDYTPTYRPLGKGEILKKGSKLAIIALGHLSTLAFNLAELLSQKGIDATIVDPIFVKPLDEELFFQLLEDHNHFITIEEHAVNCGLGSILSFFFAKNQIKDVRLQMFGIPDKFIEHGDYQNLLKEIGLTAPQILEKLDIHELFDRS